MSDFTPVFVVAAIAAFIIGTIFWRSYRRMYLLDVCASMRRVIAEVEGLVISIVMIPNKEHASRYAARISAALLRVRSTSNWRLPEFIECARWCSLIENVEMCGLSMDGHRRVSNPTVQATIKRYLRCLEELQNLYVGYRSALDLD